MNEREDKFRKNVSPSEDDETVKISFRNSRQKESSSNDEDMTSSRTIVFPGHKVENNEEPGKPARKHHKISVRKMLTRSRWMAALAVLANVLLVYDALLLTKYSSLKQSMFVKIDLAVLAVLVVLDLFAMASLFYKKKNWVIIALVISIILSAGGSYAAYALVRINSSVNDLTSTTYTKSVSAALVIYSGNSDPISSVSDLDGKTVGFARGTDTAEIGKSYLEKKKVSAEYKEYNSYTELFSGLINGDIASAVMPVQYESIIDSDSALDSYFADTSILASFDSNVTATTEAGADKDLTTEPFTVLISGENEGLADTIILVSVNPISMNVTMTSIARDSYVPITCNGNVKSKINSAHAVSESCLVDTVEQLTGVKIDYTVEFTFASVIEIVDAVGGVDVANDRYFVGQSWNIATDSLKNLDIPYDESGGLVHMNGEEALAFVRERHAFDDGDFARQRHQQAVIEDIIAKVMATKDPNTYLNILQAAGNNIKTNMSADQVLNFVSYAMQKATRYYNPSDLAGVFNFITGRITGYDSSIYSPEYGFNLYTYELYNGAIEDARKAIERNISTTDTPSAFTGASWNADTVYTAPKMIQDTYDEAVSYDDSSNSYSSDTDNYSYDNSTQYYQDDYSSYDNTQSDITTQDVPQDNTQTYDQSGSDPTVTGGGTDSNSTDTNTDQNTGTSDQEPVH